ncbi:MAG: tripartite tricarboxylate transporter substrate binding protein [Burkholderiales bacterium]|nr:tripartite tricarboxylate transporter substrate binding protein [Burkholderiales bacterium]
MNLSRAPVPKPSILLLSAFAALAAGAAPAQGYPARSVRIVVPFAAGGLVDTVARAMVNRLSETLGQPVVIDNRGGAGGTIGLNIVARAAPDGYTLAFTGGPAHVVSPLFMKNVPFDTIKDVSPIIMVGMSSSALVVHPSVPAVSVKELIDYVRKNPGRLSYASSGIGSVHHLGGLLLNRAAGIDLVHVPYKGGGAALNDVLAGQVPMAMLALSTVIPHARSARLRMLGVLETQRSRAAPDVVTVAEAGVPGYAVPYIWAGLLGPASLPAAIADRLNAAGRKAVEFADVRARFEAAGIEVMQNSPREFADYMAWVYEIYARMMAEAGIRPV